MGPPLTGRIPRQQWQRGHRPPQLLPLRQVLPAGVMTGRRVEAVCGTPQGARQRQPAEPIAQSPQTREQLCCSWRTPILLADPRHLGVVPGPPCGEGQARRLHRRPDQAEPPRPSHVGPATAARPRRPGHGGGWTTLSGARPLWLARPCRSGQPHRRAPNQAGRAGPYRPTQPGLQGPTAGRPGLAKPAQRA
jgi:hypothetical protein